MGRGSGNAAGLAGRAVEVLEQIRRIAARLLTRVAVRELPTNELASSIRLSRRNLLGLPPPAAGTRHGTLGIAVAVRAGGIPSAPSGGGGMDLADVAFRVSENGALSRRTCITDSVAMPTDYFVVRDWPAHHWTVNPAVMNTAEVKPVGGGARRLTLDNVRAAAVTAVEIGKIRSTISPATAVREALRRPTLRNAIRSSIAAAYRVPLVRRSMTAARGVGLNTAERERLATTAGIPVDSVVLIGVFPNIPVTAVSRMSVEGAAGALKIWLRPDAASSSVHPKMLTLIVGRNATTGKMIQAVA